ncbi:hypothetical protein N0V84_003580 [Fusarium piperis]|uniref:Uncharacterized protein n=1 Tax=Fusarium piperis TaxID=1435070 RepID=A0A9W9BS04_9HYPO|nr:hypothetical protein N0V84_003580 [Fusarium piperis]
MNITSTPFAEISAWVNRSDEPFTYQASFAHLKVSRDVLSDESAWSIIIAGLWDAEWGICVGSSLDAGTAYFEHGKLSDIQGDAPNFKFSCYGGWVEMLQGWRVDEGWDMDMGTVDLVVVAFVIDPQMSAECALALIATVQWAADISSEYTVRILTISSEDAPRSLRKLLYHCHLCHPHTMSLNPPDSPASMRREVQKIIQTNQSDLIQRFQRESRLDLERQVVISWHTLPPFHLDEDRHIVRTESVDQLVQDRFMLDSNLALMRRGEWEARFLVPVSYSHAQNTASQDCCFVRFVNPALRPPSPLDGFHSLHLFLSSHRTQLIYDAVTGQLTRVNLPVSQDERLEQVAWGIRTRNVPDRICIYTEASTVDEFVSAGSHHRRLKICNEQVGGFIAAACRNFSHWGIDGPSVVSCFFESNIETMAHLNTFSRLHVQGVLGDRELTIGLVGRHATIFDQVLPLVGFDYRLALFVALPSDNAIVRQIKVQLAALLTVGTDRLFAFDEDVSEVDLSPHCGGWSKPLARTGCMWLALGLWKGGAMVYDDYKVPQDSLSEDGKLRLGESEIMVDISKCHQINKIIKLLCDTIMAQEIPMLPINSSAESRELLPREFLELQKHLLHAYIFQLTEGAGGPKFYDVSACMSIDATSGIPHWAKSTLDFQRIRQSDLTGNGIVFGIYHGMERDEGSAASPNPEEGPVEREGTTVEEAVRLQYPPPVGDDE